jgi:hypothetical protein
LMDAPCEEREVYSERQHVQSGLGAACSERHVVELLEAHHGVGLGVELLPRDHLLHHLAEDVPSVTMLRLELRRHPEQLAW